MYKQLRGPERLFRIGQWGIALLFAYFLIQIGASVIADLPAVTRAPQLEDFVDQAAIGRIETAIAPVEKQVTDLDKQWAGQRVTLETARANYRKDKESFENWKETRTATEGADQNPEVVARARRLDAQLEEQRELEAAMRRTGDTRTRLEESIRPNLDAIEKLKQSAQEQFEVALRHAALKAFFIRLLFVGPLLVVAIWLFRKHRKGKQWPFAWGFILFALFAFFFELVPYLPSFGGYIRYGVGAALTLIGGKALINALQRYLERKQQEQAAPQEQRKQDIRYEKALESMAKEQCPSCERRIPDVEGAKVNYCMHCGLKVYKTCCHCQLRHNAFFPFCPSCGTPAEACDDAEAAAPSPGAAASAAASASPSLPASGATPTA